MSKIAKWIAKKLITTTSGEISKEEVEKRLNDLTNKRKNKNIWCWKTKNNFKKNWKNEGRYIYR